MKAISSRFLAIPVVFALVAFVGLLAAQPAWAAEDNLTVGASSASLVAQDEPSQFDSPDGLVSVYKITAGTVSYDAGTKTLTLNGVTADKVGFKKDGSVTLNLVGANTLDVRDEHEAREYYYDEMWEEWDYNWVKYDCTGSVAIKGSGSLDGTIELEGNVTMGGGTVKGSVDCSGDFTMMGGTVNATSSYDTAISCSGNFTMKGGTVTAGSSGKAVESEGGITLAKGTNITGSISCSAYDREKDKTLARNIAMNGGTVKGSVDCSGNFTMMGGTVNATSSYDTAISCSGNFTMKGGTVTAATGSDYDDSAISCSNLSVSKGAKLSAKATGSSTAISCSSRFVATKDSSVTVTAGRNGKAIKSQGGITLAKGTNITGSISCSAENPKTLKTLARNITMNGGTVKGSVDCSGKFTMNGGTVKGSVDCSGKFTMNGGTVKKGVDCSGFTMKGGSIKGGVSCSTFLMTRGAIENAKNTAVDCSGKFTMKGGSVKGGISCSTFLMTKGAIDKAKGTAVDCSGNFTMKGGSITSKSADTGISIGGYEYKTRKAIMSGGKIMCTSPSHKGIELHNANLSITGGTIKISKSYEDGISCHSTTYRGKTYGGKIVAKKGSISVTIRKLGNHYWAIYADSMSNKASCLKSIKGALPLGASFSYKGNTYKVTSSWNTTSGDVSLEKYGAKSTAPVFDQVKFGGVTYDVEGVGANAFNTATGKKVNSIRFKRSIDVIGSKAFANTKSLSMLKFDSDPTSWKHDDNGNFVSVGWPKGSRIAKNAFAQCGKDGGAGLTLMIRSGIDPERESSYRRAFESKGLPSSVTIATYQYQ